MSLDYRDEIFFSNLDFYRMSLIAFNRIRGQNQFYEQQHKDRICLVTDRTNEFEWISLIDFINQIFGCPQNEGFELLLGFPQTVHVF